MANFLSKAQRDCVQKFGDFIYEMTKPIPNAKHPPFKFQAGKQKDLLIAIMTEEEATLEGQFALFAVFMDYKRLGDTITLWRSDYWMRQAKILEDRRLTMTDTGDLWFQKFTKTEITWDEWLEYLADLCELKELDEEEVKITMTNCGMPGQAAVIVPQYRDFFDTFKKREKMLF